MAHLKCVEHKRRVLVFQDPRYTFAGPSVMHRSDGTHCHNKGMLRIDRVYGTAEQLMSSNLKGNKAWSATKAKKRKAKS
jgi:hypothetical protein